MKFDFGRVALATTLTVALCVAALAGQKDSKSPNKPSASPQAKTTQPATHFTQGTISSISDNSLVISQKVRGKEKQATFSLNPDTQRTGNLSNGSRVTVQYRDQNGQKTATAVRETAVKSARSPKASKSATKS